MNPPANEADFYARRALMLAQLLMEAETALAAAVGTPPKDITIEAVLDASILALRDATNTLTHIDIRIVDDKEQDNL